MSFPMHSAYKEVSGGWFSELPMHWDVKKLKHVALINPSNDKSTSNEGVTFLPMEADSETGEYEVGRISKRETLPDSLTEFKKGDVILAKITPCFENGKGAHLAN